MNEAQRNECPTNSGLLHADRVAVLFACADSIYKALPVCEVYDKKRNALRYEGGLPVVAHPPCRAWASLRHCAKPEPGEKELAYFALAQVRKNGGVLEHPHRTTFWQAAGLPDVGEVDQHGGYTIVVDQNWWGHRAQKRTRLYICGVEPRDLPRMPLTLGHATHTVGLWSGRDKARCRPSIGKKEFEATPHDFAIWLVTVAQIAGM